MTAGELRPPEGPARTVGARRVLAALRDRVGRNRFLLGLSAATVIVGMAVTLLGLPLMWGRRWDMGGDAWLTVEQARFVSVGAMAAVYTHLTSVSALPGLAILYAPLVLLGDHLHLVEGFPMAIPHPTMWLVIGPAAFAVGTLVLWGVDALAAELGTPRSRRRALSGALAALLVVPMAGMLGHPEDLAAAGAVCFALTGFLRRRHGQAAWWLAAGIMLQSWVLLICPLLLFATPAGRRLAFAVRTALIPVVTFGLCVLGAPAVTVRQVITEQPMAAPLGQHTPWILVAHHLATVHEVSGAPSRRWLTLGALALGAIAGPRVRTPRQLVMLATVLLLLRPLFETSAYPNYAVGGAVLVVALAAPRAGRAAWLVVCGVAVVLTSPLYGFGYLPHINPWLFVALLVATESAVLAMAALSGARVARGDAPGPSGEEAAPEPRPAVTAMVALPASLV